jgi:hypothetical protein
MHAHYAHKYTIDMAHTDAESVALDNFSLKVEGNPKIERAIQSIPFAATLLRPGLHVPHRLDHRVPVHGSRPFSVLR